MEKIVFTDGTKICVLTEEGKRSERESGFILNYKENARRIVANNAWKRNGPGAGLRGDYEFSDPYEGENAPAYLNGVAFTNKKDTVVYSFTVGQSSGIYYKDFSREEQDETHLIHSSSQEFLSLSFNKKDGGMLATMRKNGDCCATLAQFTPDGDYNALTEGDAKDENPSFSLTDGKILFNSAGVGRNERGEFVSYGNAVIYQLNPFTLDMDILKEDKKFSYTKPKRDKEGNLYAIKKPLKEQSENIFLQILRMPVRIVEALIGFIQFFVLTFSGKTLISNKSAGSNPARGREKKEREIFVEGNRIQVDKELKRNARFKEKDYGFIPRSWQLVQLCLDGTEKVIKLGVADYALGSEGIYCTDGKHIYLVKENQTTKIADTDFCLNLDVDA